MFFVTSLKTGGSEKACVRTANALVPFFDVTVCTLFGGGALQKELSPQVNVKSVFPRFIRGAAHIASYIPPEICHKLFIGGGVPSPTMTSLTPSLAATASMSLSKPLTSSRRPTEI